MKMLVPDKTEAICCYWFNSEKLFVLTCTIYKNAFIIPKKIL